MQSGRKALLADRSSHVKEILAPRRDSYKRVSKPNKFHDSVSKSRDPYLSRTNSNIEDEQTRKWVSEEDNFVLKQSKKKAEIRAREGRAKPIDWLAVILQVIDPDRDLLDDDDDHNFQHEGMNPESVFEGLDDTQLTELSKDISSYITLEKNKANLEYWKMMRTICEDLRQKLNPLNTEGRAVGSVAADVDKLLRPKTFEQLEILEKQIKAKLQSNVSLDVDYWDYLLRNLLLWKAKAKLKEVYQTVIDSRLNTLKKQHQEDAKRARIRMQEILSNLNQNSSKNIEHNFTGLSSESQQPLFLYSEAYDPSPSLKKDSHEKSSGALDETIFLKKVVLDRQRIIKSGLFPPRQHTCEKNSTSNFQTTLTNNIPSGSQRNLNPVNDDVSQTTKALYEREAARGIDEDEEIFTGEEAVTTVAKPQWADKYRPRKPRYFNRVQMGYEWNKYNQTHYDHDNPPPKVVQGYKFNIFYPDLIDKSKAPTFKIIRENGRKKGMSFAPAGEEDTCLIRFIAGPPYEDIAFRIVDKEWDYSAKRDRGFRSSFDKGILQLHFQYKKIYYRK
ncbi:putative cactin protein [Erysiphe necator]|uniref:Splicing factor Cactin n=1 Tax=Uncinula necator TaxID=52586 RepID=A0A0B1PA08_UNCNE|nr:putative cactin protein [Erysiphe necator]